MESVCTAGPILPFPGGTAGTHNHRPPHLHAERRSEAGGGPSAIAVAFKNLLAGRSVSSLFSLLRRREGQPPAARRGSPLQPAAMASREASETFFSLSGVRGRMLEKKKCALKTAKLNASIASKIKTKIINNSSTIKLSLKHNNKALALALNGMKANVQQLTQEKTILQKEVEECHFQNAVLRHKLSFMFHTSSAPLWNGQKNSITQDSWANDIADVQLVRATGMPMRVPISKPRDGCISTAAQTFSLDFLSHASNEPMEVVPVASKNTLPPQPAEKPQSPPEKNEKKITEAMEAQEVFLGSCIFGEAFCTTKENPNSLPVLPLENHCLSHEGNEIAKHLLDRLSQGYVTQRRKNHSLIASSTPSSGVDVFSPVSSTWAAECCITKDSSSSRKSDTEPQLKSPISVVSPNQTTVTPDRKSLGKEIFCDQPQDKETGCGVEMDPTYTRVPEFVPVKAKNKCNSKTGEKKTRKKASMGKNKTNAIKKNGESSPDTPQGKGSAQNTKKLLQPKVATCPSESEVSEMRQKGCMEAFDRNNMGCGTEQHSCFPAQGFLSRRTYVVNPAQLQSPESSDLLKQVKDTTFEIQHMESLPGSPVCTFSSLEVLPDDSSLQNPLFLRKQTSRACALQEDSSVNTKSIRQKTNRKTRIIRQRGDSEEENLPNSVKTAEAKAEEQPRRSQTSRRKTFRKGSCHDQRNEVDVFGLCMDVQGVTEESKKDLQGSLKHSRKTYTVSPLDLAENMGCVQTNFEDGAIVPPRSVPGSKASKIPRAQRMVAAQNKTKGLQEKGQAKADNNMNTSEKESCPKAKLQRENTTSRPPEGDSLASQSDGAKVLIGSSTELASKQTVLTGKISCTADLPDPDACWEEQMANTDLSHTLKSSRVTYSAALSVSSWLTDAPVSMSLSTEDSRMPKKSPVCLESFLTSKEKTAEEIPEEKSQVKLSSQNSPSQEPATRPLQDLTNASALSSSSSEGVTGRSSKRKWEPGCYKEPKLNSKLRQGDPFTNTEFLNTHPSKTKKKTAKPKEITKKIKKKKNSSLKEMSRQPS
ncbi:shugoshin 2-like isoform X2 [Neopsephotus bourkii]|uniref:shugoshin 2-like isoform X2 n=1 Tax=Neopsephotus bourkii TaxID=309878 RepID=UPI002AA52B42|nr:shugoshin 2-like isoform X2 [Neopsephotus bourkii]